jgi:hypothetical protein
VHGPLQTRRRRWTDADGSDERQERQYEHIKESYEDRGVSTHEAKERAARTVNKQKGKSKKKDS